MKPVFYCAANADRWKLFDDWEARLAQKPKTSHPRIPISPLTPQGFFIYLSRPLDLDRDLRITLGCEDIRPPWLTRWSNARDFCFGVPATRSCGLNGQHFQLAMLFTFICGETGADLFVREESSAPLGLLEHHTRIAAWHPKIARLTALGLEHIPLVIAQIKRLNL